MPDELTETTPEAQEEAAPELTEEQVKAYLEAKGIDYAKAKNISTWEKDVNKRSSDLGRIAKEVEELKQVVTSKPDEDDTNFDPAELDTFVKALKKVGLDPDEMKAAIALTRSSIAESVDDVADDFFKANADLKPEDVIAEMTEMGYNLNTITPAKLKKGLAKAAGNLKVKNFDIEAEVKKRLDEAMANLKSDGSEVVSVKKGHADLPAGHRDYKDVANDESLSWWEKMDTLAVADYNL